MPTIHEAVEDKIRRIDQRAYRKAIDRQNVQSVYPQKQWITAGKTFGRRLYHLTFPALHYFYATIRDLTRG